MRHTPSFMPVQPAPPRCAGLGLWARHAALCLGLGAAAAWAEPAPPALSTGSWRLSDETWQLPHGETMGMTGGNVLLQVHPNLKLGVGSYGAVRGQRGGFITLGLAAEGRWPIDPDWALEAGAFVGGGGGRGGATLAGGGLMLRSHLGLSYELRSWGHPSARLSLGYSQVDFPSGVIRSRQPYLAYEYDFSSPLLPGWHEATGTRAAAAPSAADAPARAQAFSLTARHYRIAPGVVHDDGAAQHPTMELLGAQWIAQLDERRYLRLHAEGAMGGRSTGYMQILVGGGYRWPLAGGRALKLQAAAGPAGGGKVDTGGGLLIETGVALEQPVSRQFSIEMGLSRLQAPSRSFKTDAIDLKLTHRFAIPGVSAQQAAANLGAWDSRALRLRTINQRYSGASANWRTLPDQTVDNLGIALDHFVGTAQPDRRWFLTGQGLAAHTGKAGAYMTGLFGAGIQQDWGARWYTEVEGLIGAAGGGGLATGNGFVLQAMASAGYRLHPQLSLLASAGRMTAPRGPFKADVLGLGLAWQFTGLAQR